MNYIAEMEKTLLDQIEKLNDDSLFTDAEAAKMAIEKSKAMSDLASQVVSINRLKLDVVHEVSNNGGIYEKYLGINE